MSIFQALAFPSGEAKPADWKTGGSNFHEEEAIMEIKQTKQQKFRSWDKRRTIVALLATAEIISSAQAQEQTETITLDPVVVTGTRYTSDAVSVGGKEPVKPREIPQSVSVVTKERIEDQGAVTLSDALKLVPGITAQPNSSWYGDDTYYSRGYTLKPTYDGLPAYNSFGAAPQLDMAIYERVEVLRGPAGLFQGAAASNSDGNFGGVVNLVRKRGQKEFAAAATLSGGTWDNHNAALDLTGPLNADGSLRARAVVSSTDRQYFYDDAKSRKLLGYFNLDWDITPATAFSLAYSTQKNNLRGLYSGVPAAAGAGELLDLPRSTNLNPKWNTIDWDTRDITAELSHRFENGWSANAKYNRREQDYFYRMAAYVGAGIPPASGNVAYQRTLRDVEAAYDAYDIYLAGPFSLFGREHRAVVGYNYSKSSSFTTGANCNPLNVTVPFGRQDLVGECWRDYHLGNEAEYWQSGYYGQLRLRLAEPLTFIVGARSSDYRQRTRNPPPAATVNMNWTNNDNVKTDDEVTPYGGLLFDVSKQVSLYASYADIFIPQANTKFGGDPIGPRTGKQYEIGAKGEFLDGKLIASLARFDLRDKNRAYQDPDSGHPNSWLALGEVESKGWEVEVAGRPAPGWDIQAGYTRLDTRYKKDRLFAGVEFSPKEPKHLFKLWGVRRFGGNGPLNGLSVGLGLTYVSETRASATNTVAANTAAAVRKQPAYTLADGFLSYRINKNASLAFNAYNLFDKSYYARLGSTGSLNIYGEPRSYKLTLRIDY
ncbi:MAG: TonB-dependent siderophore receptor [Zoogloeaceae bacterium]|jgi:outer membrane receptor for ferric coprogen and ferric-rhodotorulic acid|nr:TonB-dependent siderophore receptor [Zoogloeaceae bacterium]